MKILSRKSTSLFTTAIVAVVVFTFIFILGLNQVGAQSQDEGGRLITIHDRGQQSVLLSDAQTIGDALNDAGVSLDERDAVEPAADTELVAREYDVNIYRARPVLVVDGASRTRIVTPYQTGELIAKDAGITLAPEDRTILSRSDDIVADGAGLQLTVDRSTPIEVNLFGAQLTIRTQAATVGEMLKEKNIELEGSDRVSVGLDTAITSGMSIRAWREGKQTITATEKVAFDIQQIQDADRAAGYKSVQTPGSDGERIVTYEIEIKDGQEVSRSEITSIVTKEPVKQVEVVGIKVLLTVNYSADKAAIMTAAGVAPADQDYAAYIINNENALWCPIRWQGTRGCGESYYEKFPGAETSDQVGYGLCQSTPAIKMASAGADWRTNAVTQMKWCHSYAIGRYGSWQAAYQFKVSRGWW
jgi:uncharacterized protein YabE (DUF348 family)